MMAMAEDVSVETLMPCRTTFLNDPVITAGRNLYAADPPDSSGLPQPDADATVDPMPVVLFEPERIIGSFDTRTGTMNELRTSSIRAAGFSILTDLPIWVVEPADGWGVYRTSEGLNLRDAAGGVWAEGHVDLDQRWVSSASDHGSALVLFGPGLGIRPPRGKTESSYSLQDKIEEFRETRARGLCAAALVKWYPTPSARTVNWSFFGPGFLGIQLPIAYAPQWSFDALGGPEAFGFKAILGQRTEPPVAERLVAEASPTDFDLLNPELDTRMNFVAGFHRHPRRRDRLFKSWQKLVNGYGAVVVITGHHDLDDQASTSQLRDVLRHSYIAVVHVRAQQTAEEKWGRHE